MWALQTVQFVSVSTQALASGVFKVEVGWCANAVSWQITTACKEFVYRADTVQLTDSSIRYGVGTGTSLWLVESGWKLACELVDDISSHGTAGTVARMAYLYPVCARIHPRHCSKQLKQLFLISSDLLSWIRLSSPLLRTRRKETHRCASESTIDIDPIHQKRLSD